MINQLKRFTSVVWNEPHLKPVLPVNSLFVCFQYDYQFVYLEISHERCSAYTDYQERTDLWIKGSKATIVELLTGKVRLRTLESRTELTITGKLKDILLLETLFALCEKRLSA